MGFFLNKTIRVFSSKDSKELGVFCTNLCFIEFSLVKGLGNRRFAQSSSANWMVETKYSGSISCDQNQPSGRFA